ncbi:hypothetical protein EAI70_20490 [Escherichia coli]|nr:hypothetical protein EAI70_20490 [Escherichia coli]
MLETVCLRYSPKGRQRKAPPDYKSKFVLTPKSWTVKHEAYRSDSDIQLESDLLIYVLTPKSWTVKHEAYRSDSDIQLESDLLISG